MRNWNMKRETLNLCEDRLTGRKHRSMTWQIAFAAKTAGSVQSLLPRLTAPYASNQNLVCGKRNATVGRIPHVQN